MGSGGRRRIKPKRAGAVVRRQAADLARFAASVADFPHGPDPAAQAWRGVTWGMGEEVGLEGLSEHDCRHYWATYWARKVDVLRLQEAGGGASLALPRRYVEDSEIANKGMA